MIRHVVLFTWNAETTDADIVAITQGLRQLPSIVPELRAYHVGPDLNIGGNADYAVVADFDDLAGYEAYRDHPEHVSVRDTLIMPKVASRSAVQYEIGAPTDSQP